MQATFRPAFLAFLAVSFFFFQCKNSTSSNGGKSGDRVAEPPSNALFKRLPSAETGVTFANRLTETYENNILVDSYLYNGGGVAVIDANNDGLPDLFFTALQGPCKLFINKGNLKFEDATDAAGVALPDGSKSGATVVDINGDGWQDIYVCRTGVRQNEARRNVLFINQKNGTFKDAANYWGLDDIAASNHANFFDYDLDGDLDCYVLNYPSEFRTVNAANVKDLGGGKLQGDWTPQKPEDSDHFYRNEGGKMVDISQKAGIWNRAWGLSATVSDLNFDGWPDVYVGNDYIVPDFLYINDQKGGFLEQNRSIFKHTSNHTMGVDIADLNGDGLQDIVALDMLAEPMGRQKKLMTTMTVERFTQLRDLGYGSQVMRNVLQINNGDGSFSEVGEIAGIDATDWSWAPLAQDFDLDGRRDLVITNGYRRDVTDMDYLSYTLDSVTKKHGNLDNALKKDLAGYFSMVPSTPLQNYAFRNSGGLKFENVSTAWGLVEKTFSNGSAYADLDLDGDLELIVSNIDDESYIYRNTAVEQGLGAWLQVRAEGSPQNTQAVGATVRVTAGGQIFQQDLTPTRGFLSSQEMLAAFGFGKIQKAEKVEVRFPDGKIWSKNDVALNQRLTAKWAEAQKGAWDVRPATRGTAFFAEASAAPRFQHLEDNFQDFNRERLLPYRFSTPGPALAVGDANGDGLEDFFVGGGTGQAGAVFFQQRNSTFTQSQNASAFEADKMMEDAAAIFFDADADGDQDLFVASGGNAHAAGAEAYAPRLYKNDGKGAFSRDAAALPKIFESSAAVAARDVDGDGKIDLLLAGAVVPGRYPETPKSYFLKNEGGKFSDQTAALAPDFQKAGMIRALEWADLDGDKNDELIALGDWTRVEIFKNEKGKLTRATEAFGLAGSSGLWRSAAAGDFDGDGDVDLVCGNYGLNNRYSATADGPLTLWAKDFDGNGSIDPMMAFYENGKCYPTAYRDVLLKQMPSLKKKFVRYGPYAKACMTDVFSQKELDSAQKLEAAMLASTFFENQNGKMVARPLPDWAQVSPMLSFWKSDLDGDGDLDLVGAGNERGQQPETGPIDASVGVVLLNDGKGHFEAQKGSMVGFRAGREARQIRAVKMASGKTWVLVGNSNDFLQAFEKR